MGRYVVHIVGIDRIIDRTGARHCAGRSVLRDLAVYTAGPIEITRHAGRKSRVTLGLQHGNDAVASAGFAEHGLVFAQIPISIDTTIPDLELGGRQRAAHILRVNGEVIRILVDGVPFNGPGGAVHLDAVDGHSAEGNEYLHLVRSALRDLGGFIIDCDGSAICKGMTLSGVDDQTGTVDLAAVNRVGVIANAPVILLAVPCVNGRIGDLAVLTDRGLFHGVRPGFDLTLVRCRHIGNRDAVNGF